MVEELECRKFTAHLELLHQMVAFVKDKAQQVGFEGSLLEKMQLVAEEALVNIISYAYPHKKGEIEILCYLDEAKFFKVVFKDQGIPFNPVEEVGDVDIDATLEERGIGGLGVFIIKNMMDEVIYSRQGDKNILTLVKRVP
ncbi:MAG: ATP-binding protein [Chlamydiota bacterium]